MSRFDDFWSAWPANGKPPFDNYRRKTNPAGCKKVWGRKGLDKHADAIIRDVQQRALYDAQWHENKGQFMQGPHPYLNQENWLVPFADSRDEKKKSKPSQTQDHFDTGPNLSKWARYANRKLLDLIIERRGIGDDALLADLVRKKNEVVRQAEQAGDWDVEDFKSVIKATLTIRDSRGTSEEIDQAAA